MKTRISIKKNYGFNLVYQIVTFMIPLITIPYISRIFGADGVGIQSYTNAIASYFILFAALGTAVYGAREIARTRDDRHQSTLVFWEIVCIRTISTLICLGAWSIIILFSRQYKTYYLVLSIQIFSVLFDITWFYEGQEEFRIIVIRNIIIKILNVVFLFSFIHKKSDLWIYMGSIGLFTLLGNFFLWKGMRNYLDKIYIKDLCIKRHIKEIIIYFIPTIATSVYIVFDKAMIGFLTGLEEENGYYEQAERIITIGKVLVKTLPTVMTTRMSYLFALRKETEIKKKLELSIDFIMALAIPTTFGIAGTAKKLVPWYFGIGYEKVELLLYITCPLILIVGLSGYIGLSYLTPSGQRAKSSKAILAGALLNFVLNCIFIPRFYSIGAAAASVAAETLITVMFLCLSKNYISVKMIWKYSWKKLAASLGMFFVITLPLFQEMQTRWQTTLLQILTGGAVYLFLLIFLKDSIIKTLAAYGKEWICR